MTDFVNEVVYKILILSTDHTASPQQRNASFAQLPSTNPSISHIPSIVRLHPLCRIVLSLFRPIVSFVILLVISGAMPPWVPRPFLVFIIFIMPPSLSAWSSMTWASISPVLRFGTTMCVLLPLSYLPILSLAVCDTLGPQVMCANENTEDFNDVKDHMWFNHVGGCEMGILDMFRVFWWGQWVVGWMIDSLGLLRGRWTMGHGDSLMVWWGWEPFVVVNWDW